MCDLETTDAELRLLLAIRHMVCEAEGRAAEHRADRRAAGRAIGNYGLEHRGRPCIGEMPGQLLTGKTETLMAMTLSRDVCHAWICSSDRRVGVRKSNDRRT